jgi:hypothetical protein
MIEHYRSKKQEAAVESQETFELTKSPEGLGAIEIHAASEHTRTIVRGILLANRFDDPDYQERIKVGAFLQGDSNGWLLIEFWKGSESDHRSFYEYVKSRCDQTRGD